MDHYLTSLSKTLISASLILTSCFLQAQLNYRFHWGKIPVAEFSLELPQGDSQTIKLEGRTVGFVGAIFSYDGVIQSDYSDIDSVIFQISGVDNGFSEHRKINFFSDQSAEILDFLDDEQEQPADEIVESMGITADPLRVIFALLSAKNELSTPDNRCIGEFSVFDGKRHYRLKLEAGDWENLKADRSWSYAGQALRCDMLVTQLEATSGEEQNPWYDQETETRSLWLAELEGEFVMVRISMPGPIGRITGRLELPKAL